MVVVAVVVVVVAVMVVVVRRQGTGRKRRVGTDTPTRRQHSKQTHTSAPAGILPFPAWLCTLFSTNPDRTHPPVQPPLDVVGQRSQANVARDQNAFGPSFHDKAGGAQYEPAIAPRARLQPSTTYVPISTIVWLSGLHLHIPAPPAP